MHKILAVVAVVALAALGTSIIATVLLRSSVSNQSGRIGALQRAEHADHKQIAALESEVCAEHKRKNPAAARLLCTQVPQPVAQSGVAESAKAGLLQSDLFYSGLPWQHAP